MPKIPSTTLVDRLPFTEWTNLHAYLVWIYDGEIEPQWRKGVIESPHLTAWLIRRGHVTAEAHNRKFTAVAGQWFFPPSTEALRREFSEDARILSVRFCARWPTGEQLFDKGLGITCEASQHPQLERAARPLAQFAALTFPKGYRLLMEQPATLAQHLRLQALFARWLDAAVCALEESGLTPSRMGRIDTRLLNAVRLIERQTLATIIPERQLAGEVGLSVSQLARLFIRQFGVTPHAYAEQRRYEHALAALRSSPQSIKEIAFELGFSSLPHFSGWFRRRNGNSPRHVRQRQRASPHS